jgi:hypothetical protein
MNVNEFLKERSSCPICGYWGLTTYFCTGDSPQTTTYESDNRLMAKKFLNPLKRKSKECYQAGYSFSLENSSFCIEFYTEKGERLVDQTRIHLMEKFKEYDKNIDSKYHFLRQCNACRNYLCKTSVFNLDLKTTAINFDMMVEVFGFVTKTEDDYKTVVLSNNYSFKASKIYCWRGDKEDTIYHLRYPSAKVTQFKLPLIPFVSKEKTEDRINTLLLFS